MAGYDSDCLSVGIRIEKCETDNELRLIRNAGVCDKTQAFGMECNSVNETTAYGMECDSVTEHRRLIRNATV